MVLFIITAILVFMGAISNYLFIYMNHESRFANFILKLFDLNTEGNIPTLFSTLLLLTASIVLGLIYIKSRIAKSTDQIYWISLSIIFLFLSLDEALQIHEKVTNIIDLIGTEREISGITERPGYLRYVWVIPYFIMVVVIFITFYKFIFNLPAKTRNLFLLSGFIFVTGAVGLELLEAYFDSLLGANIYTVILYNIEEAMEMIGVIIFIYALLDFMSIEENNVQVNFSVEFQQPAHEGKEINE